MRNTARVCQTCNQSIFPDLYGAGNTNLLKYDFSVLNKDGTLKYLIECQGEQHFKPVDEFGGMEEFEKQQKMMN